MSVCVQYNAFVRTIQCLCVCNTMPLCVLYKHDVIKRAVTFYENIMLFSDISLADIRSLTPE